jgi:hypothetical protein
MLGKQIFGEEIIVMLRRKYLLSIESCIVGHLVRLHSRPSLQTVALPAHKTGDCAQETKWIEYSPMGIYLCDHS